MVDNDSSNDAQELSGSPRFNNSLNKQAQNNRSSHVQLQTCEESIAHSSDDLNNVFYPKHKINFNRIICIYVHII